MVGSVGAGRRALLISLVGLGVTAVVQAIVVVLSGSVALLGDTLHNVADALTAVPLLIAFILAQRLPTKRYTYGYGRAEDIAGLFVIAMMALSAGFAAYEAITRLQHPQPVLHLWAVAGAGFVGFIGNEIVAVTASVSPPTADLTRIACSQTIPRRRDTAAPGNSGPQALARARLLPSLSGLVSDLSGVGPSVVAGDGIGPTGSFDETEQMTRRIGEYAFVVEGSGSQRQHLRGGRGDVFDHHVDVDLLRHRRVGPGWRAMLRCQLERQTRGLRTGRHHYPVVAVVGDRVAQQLRIEPGERTRVRAVQHQMVDSTDHTTDHLTPGVAPEPRRGDRHAIACQSIGNRREAT